MAKASLAKWIAIVVTVLLTLGLAVLGGAIDYGGYNEKVSGLEKRVDKMEPEVKKVELVQKDIHYIQQDIEEMGADIEDGVSEQRKLGEKMTKGFTDISKQIADLHIPRGPSDGD